MKRFVASVFGLLLLAPVMQGESLYEQSMGRILERKFPSPDVSYLVLETEGGTIVASRWEANDRPASVGSLLKPFTALAYARRHSFQYPTLVCRGTADRCWLPRGHGRVGVVQAIGQSCNAYFRVIASGINPDDLRSLLRGLEYHPAANGLAAEALVGLGEDFRISPEQIASAYCRLARQGAEPGVAELVRGMALSAQAGTASGVQAALGGKAILAKTGTAPCIHSPQAPGDGYVMALYPAESPRLAVLVRVHGVPGARAALVGGQVLRVAIDGR